MILDRLRHFRACGPMTDDVSSVENLPTPVAMRVFGTILNYRDRLSLAVTEMACPETLSFTLAVTL